MDRIEGGREGGRVGRRERIGRSNDTSRWKRREGTGRSSDTVEVKGVQSWNRRLGARRNGGEITGRDNRGGKEGKTDGIDREG